MPLANAARLTAKIHAPPGDLVAAAQAQLDRVECQPQLSGSLWIGGEGMDMLYRDIGKHPGAEDEGGPDQTDRTGQSGGVGSLFGDPAVQCDDQHRQCQRVNDVNRGVPGDHDSRTLGNIGDDGGDIDLARAKAERSKHGDEEDEAEDVGCGAGDGGEATGFVESHVRGP